MKNEITTFKGNFNSMEIYLICEKTTGFVFSSPTAPAES